MGLLLPHLGSDPTEEWTPSEWEEDPDFEYNLPAEKRAEAVELLAEVLRLGCAVENDVRETRFQPALHNTKNLLCDARNPDYDLGVGWLYLTMTEISRIRREWHRLDWHRKRGSLLVA